MKEKMIKTFLVSGVWGINLKAPDMDDLVNEWLKKNQEKIRIEEKIVNTSTTTFSPDGGRYHQTVITVCVMIFYHLV